MSYGVLRMNLTPLMQEVQDQQRCLRTRRKHHVITAICLTIVSLCLHL